MNRESERRMILSMLENGKIDAEEAEKLLAALSEGRSGGRELAGETIPREEERADEETPGDISEMIRGVVNSLTSSGFSLGSAHAYEREVTGQFDPEAVREQGFITIKGAAKNGRIEIKGWDADEYQVTVRAKVRGGDRSAAREVAEEYCQVKEEGAALTVDGRENLPANSSVSMEIHLPDRYVYDLDLLTSNGRLQLADLRGRKVLGRTSNGRIACSRVRARDFDLKTSNGRVQVEGAVGDVSVKTTNGAIKIAPSEVGRDSIYRAKTTNGSIAVNCTPDDQIGVQFEARTTNGKIDIPWEDLDLEIDKRRGRRRVHIKGTTAGYAERDIQMKMDLKTTNGKIRVGDA